MIFFSLRSPSSTVPIQHLHIAYFAMHIFSMDLHWSTKVVLLLVVSHFFPFSFLEPCLGKHLLLLYHFLLTHIIDVLVLLVNVDFVLKHVHNKTASRQNYINAEYFCSSFFRRVTKKQVKKAGTPLHGHGFTQLQGYVK